MDHDKPPRDFSTWSIVGILLIPVLCCAGPALIGVLGTLGLGAVWASVAHNWLVSGVFVVIALAIASVVIVLRRRVSCTSPTACISAEAQASGTQSK